ncbi:MAG: rubredoxin [Oscillospiraceae bacterium]
MKKFVCTICGYIYDEAAGIPEKGIAPGTKWEDLPNDWVCPLCGAPKALFKEQQSTENKPVRPATMAVENEEMREMSFSELSILCSNLAKGCEKQYLAEESQLFTTLADYYNSKVAPSAETDIETLINLINKNLEENYPMTNGLAKDNSDRGSLRALVWSEKVTRMLSSLLIRYKNEGESFLENTNVFVCDICGFIYVGDEAPDICPVCKVPKFKILKLQRR